jgi:hypothetical protein
MGGTGLIGRRTKPPSHRSSQGAFALPAPAGVSGFPGGKHGRSADDRQEGGAGHGAVQVARRARTSIALGAAAADADPARSPGVRRLGLGAAGRGIDHSGGVRAQSRRKAMKRRTRSGRFCRLE